MRRPRRRFAGTKEIGRDDAMIWPERVTEGRPLLVARTSAVDRDDGNWYLYALLDAEARRRRDLEIDASLSTSTCCLRRKQNVRDDPANCLQS